MRDINSEEIIDRNEELENQEIFYKLGELLNFNKEENLLKLSFDKRKVILEFLKNDIVRVIMDKKEEIDLKSTYAVVKKDKYNNFEITDNDEILIVSTNDLKIIINKSPFSLKFYNNGKLLHEDAVPALSWSKNKIKATKKTSDKEHFYGLGEKTAFLDKKGKKYTMWNTDVFESHIENTDPLYASIPFYLVASKEKNYGIYFDNSYKSHFDFRVDEDGKYSFWAEGGKMDYYFITGPKARDVIDKYTELTGKMPLPPKWSLGYHQSRYSYKNEKEVTSLAKKFREKEIPCDVIHLDIHYMDDYRVFSWDNSRFPEPKKMINNLEEDGFNIVNIIDPGIKKDADYDVYKEGVKNNYFCRYLDGEIYSGDVWPGESVFPDFTKKEVRDWWADLHKKVLSKGTRGIWNDMNEPAVFNESSTMDIEVNHENDGDSGLHKRFHNQYALLEAMGTYKGIKDFNQERPFVLSRAAFSGMQRYAAVWTGDNRSIWQHLKMAIPMLLNMGLSGLNFSGTDVGGFSEDSNGELLTRWTQLGIFMPLFRNHSSIYTIFQEPWAFGEKYEKVIKKFINLRYKFLPYLYNLFNETNENGTPILRPLFLEFPEDEKVYNKSYEFMFGESILVAPVYEAKQDKKLIYLPEGNWINFFKEKSYEGKQYIVEDTPLETMPLYIKEGSIIPLGEEKNYIDEKDEESLKIVIYFSENIYKNDYTLYEDDGISFSYKNDEYKKTKFSYENKKDSFELNIDDIYNNYSSKYNQYEIIIKNYNKNITKINSKNKEIQDWNYDLKNDIIYITTDTNIGKIVIK